VEIVAARKLRCSAKTKTGKVCPNFACHGETRCRSHGGESQGRLICTCDRFSFAHEPGTRCEQPVLNLIPKKSKRIVEKPKVVVVNAVPSPRECLSLRSRALAEQEAHTQPVEPEVPEEVLVQKRLSEIALKLEQVGTEYKDFDYRKGVSGRLALLDKMNALTEEQKRLKAYGWPKPKPEAKEDPSKAYLSKLDGRFLLHGQGGVGAVPSAPDAAAEFGRRYYGGA